MNLFKIAISIGLINELHFSEEKKQTNKEIRNKIKTISMNLDV